MNFSNRNNSHYMNQSTSLISRTDQDGGYATTKAAVGTEEELPIFLTTTDGDNRMSHRSSTMELLRSSINSLSESMAKGTIAGTVINSMCSVMGSGVLGLPLAIHNGSVIIGLIVLLICSCLSAFTSYVLIIGVDATKKSTMAEIFAHAWCPNPGHHRSKRMRDKYKDDNDNGERTEGAEEGEEEMSNAEREAQYNALKESRARCRFFVDLIIFGYNYGCLVIYARAIADALPPVVAGFLHAGGIWVSQWTWLGLAAVVFFFPTCARQLAELKWTSLIGFITIFYVGFIVFVKFFVIERHPDRVHAGVRWLQIHPSIFLSTSTFALAYGYHFNVPPMYAELQNRTPKRMMFTCAIAYPIVTLNYALCGVFGYLTFGPTLDENKFGGNILNVYTDQDVPVNIARLALFPALALSFPVLAFGPRQMIHRIGSWLVGKIVTCCRSRQDAAVSIPLMPHSPRSPETPAFEGETTTGDEGELSLHNTSLNTEEDAASAAQKEIPLFIIALEAFFLVMSSCLLAHFVPGVGVVINFIGGIFGFLMIFIVPGLIGIKLWGGGMGRNDTKKQRFSSSEDPAQHSKRVVFLLMSYTVLIIGVTLLIAGTVAEVLTLCGHNLA